ncbi:MAG: hypothetical protein M1591_03975 [Deltaproteobacteria bacterium]|nr:hypothetical protein [Deltaproteobacteria bacterium]
MIKKAAATILFSSLLAITSCINLTVSQTKEYDTMMNKAKSSLNMFSGNYADIISKHLGEFGLSDTAKGRAMPDYLDILKKYRFEVNPHGNYYDFKIIDNREWRLFDYTCTLELGSTVFMTPGRFNLNEVGLFDKCVRH